MNKFSLNIHKKKAQIMSKMGRLEITQDPEFDSLLSMHQSQKKSIQETIKCFKSVSDNFHALSTSLAVLIHSIQNTYQPSDPIHPFIERMARSLEVFDENYVQQFQKEIQFSCVDSIMNFLVSLDEPRNSILLREKSKIEYDEKRTQLNKILESKKPNAQQKILQAREKLQIAESNYQSSRLQAKTEMAQLLNAHGSQMDPSLISFQKSLSALAKGMESTLGTLGELAEDLELITFERERIEIVQQPLENGDDTGTDSYTCDQENTFEHITTLSSIGNGRQSGNQQKNFMDSTSIADTSDMLSTTKTEYPPSKFASSSNLPVDIQNLNLSDCFLGEETFSNTPINDTFTNSSSIPEEYETDWYYLNEELEQQGPFDIHELKQLYKNREISGSIHVFGGDMSDWLELDQVPRLKQIFEA